MRRWVGVVTALALAFTVGLPPGAVPADGGFPLSGLWSWLRQPAALAEVLGLPVQQTPAGEDGQGHYVSGDETRSNGGAGRAPGRGIGAVPASLPEPEQPKPWKAPPLAGADSFDEKTSKRVPERSGERFTEYKNTDGSVTRLLYGSRVNYRDAKGRYQPIDSDLTRRDGRLETTANSLTASLAAKGADESLATLTTAAGDTVALGVAGAAAAPAAVDGPVAAYGEILSSTDIEAESLADGLRTTIVLKAPAAGNEWTLPLGLDGLTANEQADGTIALADAAGKVALRMAPGRMEDAKVDPKSGAPAQSPAVTYSLDTVDGGQALKVTADPAWLTDPARQYPVRFGATILAANARTDTFADSDAATSNLDTDDLPVGTWKDASTVSRSFLGYDAEAAGDFGAKRVRAATLNLFHSWSADCANQQPIDVRRAGEFTGAPPADNGGLAAAPAYSAPIGTLKVTDNQAACANTAADRGVGKWWSVPLDTRAVSDRPIGPSADAGLALTTSETDTAAFKRFTSGNVEGGEFRPFLAVTAADNVAPQVNEQYPGYGQAVTTLSPELLADASDPDLGPKSLTYTFIIYGNDAKTEIYRTPARKQKSFVVPAVSPLKWGESYYWSVLVNDGAATNSDALYKSLLVTPVPQPAITSGLSQNSGRAFDPAVGNYTTMTRDAMVTTVGPPLEIARYYNSNDPRTGQALGAGWSSILDAKAVNRGATVVVTYPDGREMAFGRDVSSTGVISYVSPAGRGTILSPITGGGYRLWEKDGTRYEFTQLTATNVRALKLVKDVHNRTLTFNWVGNKLDNLESTSGRKLFLDWVPGVTPPRVQAVRTDPVNGAANTWTYSYTGSALTKVCPPTSTTKCHTYQHTDNSPYPTAVSNTQPSSNWRLNEAGGTVAASSVIENAGADRGTYVDVNYGLDGVLAGSASKAVGFSSSSASKVVLPAKLAGDASNQAISMWFKASASDRARVLYGQSWETDSNATTTAGYNPTLYIDKDGLMRGSFPAAPKPGSELGSFLHPENERCIGPFSGSLMLQACTGAADQQWNWSEKRQLYTTIDGATRCLAPAGDGVGNVSIVTEVCGDSIAKQKWDVRANGQIVNDYSYQCFSKIGDLLAFLGQRACETKARATWQTFLPRKHTTAGGQINVADGNWHHVVLSASGDEQILYVDGKQRGTLSGNAVQELNPAYSYLGVGWLGGGWLGNDTANSLNNKGYLKRFNGSMAEVALYDSPVSAQTVEDLYEARNPVRQVNKVLRPSGGVAADVTYDRVSGRVSRVTDSNGATWTPQAPSVGGTTKLYESAVLAGVPSDYWRLADTSGVVATNQVNGNEARYSSVTLNTNNGPFEPLGKAATFDGTRSRLDVRNPGGFCGGTCPAPKVDMDKYAVSMWFKTSVNGYPLFSYGNVPVEPGATTTTRTHTALYVDSEGHLRGQFGMVQLFPPPFPEVIWPIRSEAKVNDSKWHHVALVNWDQNQTLYLDGKAQGSRAWEPDRKNVAKYMYVGAGFLGGGYTPGTYDTVGPTARSFDGQIAEVALYNKPLDGKMVEAQFKARSAVKATVVPSVTYTVQHPDTDKVVVSKDVHDLQGGRKLAEIDALGQTTRYGYNSKGNLRTVTDPNGNMTINEHDVRGNVVSTATCQDRSENKCSTTYFTYFPNATAENPDPSVMNDRLLTRRGPGSKTASDDTYLTTYRYNEDNAARTLEIDPLGRRTTVTYTNGTSAPSGLPTRIEKPGGGVVSIAYFPNGDIREMTDPAGLKTRYKYDLLGRKTEEAEYVGETEKGKTTYVHDAQDRVVQETGAAVTNRVSGLTHIPVTATVYNDDGLPTSETVSDANGFDASRKVTYGYDQYGRKTSETDALGNELTLGYDAYGRVNKQTHADGSVIQTTFDPVGHELKVEVPGEELPIKKMSYDFGGRLDSITDARGYLTKYEYTDNNLLTKVTRYNGASENSGQGSFVEEENEYDPVGNIVTQITNNGLTTTKRTYDEAARGLTATLDPDGLNRTTTQTYSTNDDVLSTTLTKGSATVSKSEAIYDKLGRALAETTYTSADPLAPVLRWKFDSIFDGATADSAGNSRGVAATRATWSTNHGGSLALGGADADVRSEQPVVDSTRAYTVGLWVNITDTSANRSVLSLPSPTGQTAMSLSYVTGGAWQLTLTHDSTAGTGSDLVIRTDNGTATAGKWTHLAATFDPKTATATLYSDGPTIGMMDGDRAFRPLPSDSIRVGQASGSATPQGLIDDVTVFQRELDGDQVQVVKAGTDPALDARVIRTSQRLDLDGSVTSVIDPRGNKTEVENDAVGRAVLIKSPPVSTVTGEGQPIIAMPISKVGYNTFGEVTEQEDPQGNKTITRYDAAGRPIETESPSYRAPGSSTSIVAKTTNAFNAAGQVESTTDPVGATTRFKYDKFGRTTEVTAADGGVSTFKYTPNGELTEQVDPTGAKATAVYDYMGRTTSTTQAVRQTGTGYTTNFEYLSGPWPDSVKSPSGVEVQNNYNAAGETNWVKDGAGQLTRTEYDGAGRPIKMIAPDNTYETATYDLAGRLTATRSFSAGNTPLRTVSSRYDAAGNLLEATDARGTTRTFAYDALGQMVSQTEPISASDSIVSTFGYDISGQRTRFTDGRGNRFVTTYNSWGLPESQIEPATAAHPATADRTFTTSYDAGARPVRMDSPGGVRVESEYNDMGRLVRNSGTGAQVATADKTFEYDLTGRVTSLTGAAGTTTVAYDDRGLPTTIGGISGASSYAYNPDGALTSRVDAAGTTSYTYDSAGRPDKVVNTGAGVDMKYAYDNMSQVSSIKYNTTGNTRSFGYDDLHRTTSDELKTAAGASVAKIAYGWDLNDNLKTKTTTGFTGAAANTYTYDLADRLIGWDNGTTPVVYAFDKSGNRTQADGKTFTYDQRNQLMSSSDGTQYQYSARGTLTSTVEGGLEQETVTDAFNQVLSQTAAGGDTKTYTYDGLGRLIKPNLTYTGLGNTVAGDGNATYVRDVAGGLVGVASGSTKRYAWTDLHTDVVGEFSGTGAALAASVAYDPWGKVIASGGMIGKLGFQSQWTDEGTGKVNMWARWYDPETGAFDTRDAASNSPTPGSGAANRFAYAEGDPLGNTDTTGYGVDGSCGTYDYECALKKYQGQLSQYNRDMDQHNRDVQFTGQDIARQQADYARAERESNTSLLDILIQVGVGMLLDMIGYNAIVGCLEGSAWDCLDLASNFLGPVKAFKMARQLYKAIDRALNGYRMWRRIIDGARTMMNRASILMNQARKHLSDLMQKIPKKPKPPKKKIKPPAKKKPKAKAKAKHRAKAKASEPAKPPKTKTTKKKAEKPDQEKPDRPERPEGSDRPSVSDQPADQRNFVDLNKGKDPEPAKLEACHSFAPDTRVLMADGSTRPISEVNVGDKVATTNPETGENSDQQVTLLHANRDRELTDVTVSSAPAAADRATRTEGEGKGGRSTRGPTESTLETTANHPFWDATTGAWVDAAELTPGTSTLVGPNGELQYVVKVHTFTGAKVMRDLTVDTTHTYYVIAGGTPVLVHNCGGKEDGHHANCECEAGAQPRMANGQRGSNRTRSEDDPAEWGSSERRAEWKKHYNDPASPLTAAQREEIKQRGYAGPQRFNPWTDELETMELSHEPIPFRDGGDVTVPRWPDDHAFHDKSRMLKGNRIPFTNTFPGD